MDFLRLFASQPVTYVVVGLCVGLFAIEAFSANTPSEAGELRRSLGSVEVLQLLSVANPRESAEPGLFGFFDLWRGGWWRIPLTALFHSGPIHLVCNMMGWMFLAPTLEQRWGRVGFGLFCVCAAAVSMLPEYLIGNHALGYSGVVCACFGACMVLRRIEPGFPEKLDASQEQSFVVGLVLLWVLTLLDLLPVANLAHFCGLGFGALVGLATARGFDERPSPYRWGAVAGLAKLLLLLVPGFWFAVHPFWNARYFWYQATTTTDLTERVAMWKAAVAIDPALPVVWRYLVAAEYESGRERGAWPVLVRGLATNPTDIELQKLAQRLWAILSTSGHRSEAEQSLRNVLGADATNWVERFDVALARSGEFPRAMDERALPTKPKVDLVFPPLPPRSPLRPQRDGMGDAVEGYLL